MIGPVVGIDSAPRDLISFTNGGRKFLAATWVPYFPRSWSMGTSMTARRFAIGRIVQPKYLQANPVFENPRALKTSSTRRVVITWTLAVSGSGVVIVDS